MYFVNLKRVLSQNQDDRMSLSYQAKTNILQEIAQVQVHMSSQLSLPSLRAIKWADKDLVKVKAKGSSNSRSSDLSNKKHLNTFQ